MAPREPKQPTRALVGALQLKITNAARRGPTVNAGRGLFVVGDEDQTLYGWRRASVHRMIDLDAAYPALRRVALEYNYRCTPEAIAASASLIAHNRLRFAKAIKPSGERPPGGARAI